MDHKVSLTRGAPVGGAPTAYVIDDGMPCTTTAVIWMGLLLGALGTGFGAAGYAFSMENKDKLAEMAAAPSPPPPAIVNSVACLEQIFGGANSVANTWFPVEANAYEPYTASQALDGLTYSTAISKLPLTSPMAQLMLNLMPSITLYDWTPGKKHYTLTAPPVNLATTVVPTPATLYLCSSSYPCTSALAQFTTSTYQVLGTDAASGAGYFTYNRHPGTQYDTYSPLTDLEVVGYDNVPAALSIVNVKFKLSGTKAPGVGHEQPGAFTDVYVLMPYDVYYEPYIKGSFVHGTIRFMARAGKGVKFFADSTFTTKADAGVYDFHEPYWNAFGASLGQKLDTMFYTHKIDAQCASV